MKWVRASREAAPETAIRWRCREARPIGASIVPVREASLPARQRQVDALDLAPLDLGLQRRVGRVGAGDDEQAAGALVEAVDDAGPLGVGTAAEHLFELGDQGRPAVRGRRVDDEAGRLVDDGEVVVEVDDARVSKAHPALLAQEDQGEDRPRRR